MTITFLGTGTSQGVPVIACDCEVCQSLDYRDKRLRSSIHIEVDGKSIIVDTGPDFRQQVLRERITQLDAILYTHEHKDHTAGMDDVRGFNFKLKKNIPIYAVERVVEHLKTEFAYVFAEDRYPGVPQIDVEVFDADNPFYLEDLQITPIEVLHYKLPVYGFRIHDFTYITDAKYIAQSEINKVYGSKVLIINALQKKQHISHFTVEEALALIDEVQPEKAYLIHMSHRVGFHKEENEKLPDHVEFAFDGLKIHI